MKYKFNFILVFVFICSMVTGQETSQLIKGKVSFITSNNVYVKFDNTSTINVGDTLHIADKKIGCLLVKNKSSSSVVCSIINSCEINKGDQVINRISNKSEEILEEKIDENTVNIINDSEVKNEGQKIKESIYKERIKGRISVSGYSTLSDIREDMHRVMSRFSIYADHIANSKFSFESYLSYRKNIYAEEITTPRRTEFFRVYGLSARFDADPTLSFVVGRKINPKISSLGAIDGLQIEKHIGKNYIGVIAGFRPDIYDYNFNSDLFEYGGYIGRRSDHENFYSETTLGFLEQRNASEIDRRYTYFQNSSTIFKKLHLFSTLELDIYNRVNGESSNDIRLTNLFASARFRFNRYFNATVSYDSRKRILYYETFQTEIERLLDNDIARQGVRIRINGRPTNNVNAGFSYGKRFQSDDQNKSDNIYAYLGLSKIPGIGGRISVNYNVNSSNYLQSNILSLRHSRTFMKNKLYADFYYRLANYIYLNSNTFNRTLNQNYYGVNLSFNILRKLTLSVSGEYSNSSLENNYRIYTKLVKRFNSKRKN